MTPSPWGAWVASNARKAHRSPPARYLRRRRRSVKASANLRRERQRGKDWGITAFPRWRAGHMAKSNKRSGLIQGSHHAKRTNQMWDLLEPASKKVVLRFGI